MAIVSYGAGLGPLGFPGDAVDFFSLTLTEATVTRLEMLDATGYGLAIEGTGFTYEGDTLTGGDGTRLTFLGPGGAVLCDIVGLSLVASDLADTAFAQGDWEQVVLAGDDEVHGSDIRDMLGGMDGNDTLFGGRGGDVLIGLQGRDRMSGGAGADQFLIWRNRGADVVEDFADTGAANDDRIAVRRGLYDQMTMTEGQNRVILDFGGKATLVLLGLTVADIGLDDFAFVDPLAGLS